MKTERGFTLVELLLTLAITGILASIVTPMVFQIANITQYGNSHTIVLHELQNAAFWFYYDGQMAKSASGNSTLLITKPDDTTIIYSLTGTTLIRTSGTTITTLAQNISHIGFTTSGRMIQMNIISTHSGRNLVSEQGNYVVYMRPSP